MCIFHHDREHNYTNHQNIWYNIYALLLLLIESDVARESVNASDLVSSKKKGSHKMNPLSNTILLKKTPLVLSNIILLKNK